MVYIKKSLCVLSPKSPNFSSEVISCQRCSKIPLKGKKAAPSGWANHFSWFTRDSQLCLFSQHFTWVATPLPHKPVYCPGLGNMLRGHQTSTDSLVQQVRGQEHDCFEATHFHLLSTMWFEHRYLLSSLWPQFPYP